jgi:hypothetical protein
MGIRLKGTAAAVALAAAIGVAASAAEAQQRPDRVGGHPNLNGIWQARNAAYWNLEAHSAADLGEQFWKLGALAAVPAGQSVVEGGDLPYKQEALAKRDENRAGWPASDPVAKCYMPGIPRANYQPFPFQIIQGDQDILFAYAFAKANRAIHMSADVEDWAPIDQWMGWSKGHWEGDTLVVRVTSNDDRTWFDRGGNYHSNEMIVTERYTLVDPDEIRYEATIEDPQIFTKPWTITMPLYRNVDPKAELLEYNCVEFSEPLLYGKFLKEPLE